MKTVVVLAEAAEDMENARDFYDAQQVGAGDYCVHSLLREKRRIASSGFRRAFWIKAIWKIQGVGR